MKYRLALTSLIMLAMAGCGLISRPVVGGPGDCPAPVVETELLKSEEHRYCLLYPAGYTTEQPNPQETIIGSGSLLDVQNPRATLAVYNANGRSAGEVAGGIVAEARASLPNGDVRQSTTQIGGETAIVLDNLPGQEIGRQMIVVHNNLIYSLTFVPSGPAGTDPARQTEQLYQTVVDSFRFIP